MRSLKTVIKHRLPFLVPLWSAQQNWFLIGKSTKQRFTEIYRKNKWGDTESRSGHGSSLEQTQAIRRELPVLLREFGCESLLDVPCGDFFWMNFIEMHIPYIGGDIVDELVAANQLQFGSHSRQFIHLDLVQDELPQVSLVLCRDCLVHFSYRDISGALQNIKRSGSRYLLTTTFVGRESNVDIATGKWRPINLLLRPFSFPPPLKLINEEYPSVEFRDKSLGLWRTADIPDFQGLSPNTGLAKLRNYGVAEIRTALKNFVQNVLDSRLERQK